MIDRDNNCIKVSGAFGIEIFRNLYAAVHHATTVLGYQDITFDFVDCDSTDAAAMLPTCALAHSLVRRHIDVFLVLPKKTTLRNFFLSSNWAYLIEPRQFKRVTSKSRTTVPVFHFRDSGEQQAAVTAFVELLMASVEGMDRSSLAAVEWSLNEITDNVLNHADASDGGLVMMQAFTRGRSPVIKLTVCDLGKSIPTTLREAFPHIVSDEEALIEAIKEGVTRNKVTNQGNGLYGAFEVCKESGGNFFIHSNHASLTWLSQGRTLRQRNERIPFGGTLIHGTINLADPNVLAKALRFGGNVYRPVDHIERRYETDDLSRAIFMVSRDSISVGSRVAGRAARIKIENLAAMCPGEQIVVDFQNIAVISSSFADEVFGMLFTSLGPMHFMAKIRFVNASTTIVGLIDRAIAQRMRLSP